MRIIILAAGMGRRLKGHFDAPKCLIDINGETLLERYLKILFYLGIEDVTLVVGYKHYKILDMLRVLEKTGLSGKVKIFCNKNYHEGSIVSLYEAKQELKGEVLIMDGDLYFEPAMIETIIRSRKENFFLIDTTSQVDDEAIFVGFYDDNAVQLARGFQGNCHVLGEWAGCLKLSAAGAKLLRGILNSEISRGERQSGYEFIIPRLFGATSISYELVDRVKWIEIDFPYDLERARALGIATLKKQSTLLTTLQLACK